MKETSKDMMPKAHMDMIELDDKELETVAGGSYDTITDEMRQLANRLLEQAYQDLFAKYPDLNNDSLLTAQQITYWNECYRCYYFALTEEEQHMVDAYIELSRQE